MKKVTDPNVLISSANIPSIPRNGRYAGNVGISSSISIAGETGSNSSGTPAGDIWAEVPFDAPEGSEEVRRDVAQTEDDVVSNGKGAYIQADEMRLQSDRETNDLILQWIPPVAGAGETLDPPRKVLSTRLAIESFPAKMEGQNIPSSVVEMVSARMGAEGIFLSDNVGKYILKLKTDSKLFKFTLGGSLLPFTDDKGTLGINESGQDKFRFNKIYAGTGGIKTSGDVMPDENNTKSLGDSSHRWKSIFAGTDGINTSGNIMPSSNNAVAIGADGYRFNKIYAGTGGVNTSGDVMPSSTNAISVGNSSNRFKNGYFGDLLDVLKNAAIGGDLTVNGDILKPLATATKKGAISVTSTGSGNALVDYSINNGVLTLIKGNIAPVIIDTGSGAFLTGISSDGNGWLVVGRADAFKTLYKIKSGNVVESLSVSSPKTEIDVTYTTVPTNEEFDELKQQVAKAEQENADLKERLLKLEQLTQNLPTN
ncbi:Catalytic domain of bacteriophage endosialidase [Bacteroidales bacterium Barb7]|nr:Catalytic domain of bacteriophage endosialidase [Bacteroidales bacterium Barb7]